MKQSHAGRLLIGAVGLAMLWTSDLVAADLRSAPASSYVHPFAVNWTGLYLGGHLGYGQGKAGVSDPADPGFSVDTTAKGFIGGGQIGYNYQAGSVVFGIEADLSGANVDGTTVLQDATGDIVSGQPRIRWTSLVTGRLGYASGNALLYVKGGAAFGGFRYTAANLTDNEGGEGTFTRNGWTVGAGLEYALSGAWSIRGEYDYLDFGTHNVTLTDTAGATEIASFRQKLHQARIGLNYRFGY